MKEQIKIGAGAGYAGDRIEPAAALAENGQLDYLIFECLAERTIALAQLQRSKDPTTGYNPLLEERLLACLPSCHRNGVKIISNMGAANPQAAAKKAVEIAQELGLKGLTVAAVLGDDVLENVQIGNHKIMENGEPLETIRAKIVSANAYLGVSGIVKALDNGADIILTGRVADPSLFLAPMIHELGWQLDDFEKMGKGTLIGHLLECAGQVSGGYFADSRQKDVPQLWKLGFPYAVVDREGEGFITKLPASGGRISIASCTEQLLYEIHDPAHYLTPDCVADFSKVNFENIGPDQVSFHGANGRTATDSYKVSIGYRNGFYGEGQISYGGFDCLNRAKLASEIVKKRLERFNYMDLRFDLIGLNSITPNAMREELVNEVRLRVAGRANSMEEARQIGREVETLYTNGPAAGGGATQRVDELISIVSTLLPKSEVTTDIEYFKS